MAVERHRPLRRPGRERGDLLRERSASATPVGAPEPPDAEADRDTPAADRLIGQPPDVAAMNMPRAPPTGRTAGTEPTSRHVQDDLVVQDRCAHDPPAAHNTQYRSQTHANPTTHP